MCCWTFIVHVFIKLKNSRICFQGLKWRSAEARVHNPKFEVGKSVLHLWDLEGGTLWCKAQMGVNWSWNVFCVCLVVARGFEMLVRAWTARFVFEYRFKRWQKRAKKSVPDYNRSQKWVAMLQMQIGSHYHGLHAITPSNLSNIYICVCVFLCVCFCVCVCVLI